MAKHECHSCGSNEWDYANIGIPDAILCTDCGHVYAGKPKHASVKDNENLKAWPFPSKLIPFDHKLPRFNPNNHEDSPL